jgi:hypothetical protein
MRPDILQVTSHVVSCGSFCDCSTGHPLELLNRRGVSHQEGEASESVSQRSPEVGQVPGKIVNNRMSLLFSRCVYSYAVLEMAALSSRRVSIALRHRERTLQITNEGSFGSSGQGPCIKNPYSHVNGQSTANHAISRQSCALLMKPSIGASTLGSMSRSHRGRSWKYETWATMR